MISISSTVTWRRALPMMLVFLSACGGSGGSDSGAVVVTPPPVVPPSTGSDDITNHSFVTDHFIGSQNCSTCHDGLRDASGADVSLVVDWQATMMANSARDPLWRAKVASEVKRNPARQEEIEATCARCHVPMASVEAGFASVSSDLFGDTGLLHPDNPLFDAANDGVSCTLCHQIEGSAALGTDDGFSGQFSIGFDFGTDRELYGQYANPLTTPMQNLIGFTPAESGHISSSELCATCHNLSTPVLDAQGNFTNQLFPEQMVYTEWENSQFEATDSCQDCHVPKVAGDMSISTRPLNGLAPRSNFARHTFVGDDLDFSVRLTNFSGHKFPSGYPSRLLPAGMDKFSVPSTIEPQGDAMIDADFIGGSDLVNYRISGLIAGTYTVDARLNYQTMAYGYGQDLFNDVDEPQVAFFKTLDDNARLRFETISSDSGSTDF